MNERLVVVLRVELTGEAAVVYKEFVEGTGEAHGKTTEEAIASEMEGATGADLMNFFEQVCGPNDVKPSMIEVTALNVNGLVMTASASVQA